MIFQTILILDEDPDHVGVLTDYIEHYGFNAIAALTPESGFEACQRYRPDIILMTRDFAQDNGVMFSQFMHQSLLEDEIFPPIIIVNEDRDSLVDSYMIGMGAELNPEDEVRALNGSLADLLPNEEVLLN